MSLKVFLFDFDATIADTALAGVEVYNSIAVKSGYKQITSENMTELRMLSSRDAIVKLGVPLYWAPIVGARLKKTLSREIANMKPIPGMPEVLQSLKERGLQLGIVTSNTRKNVETFLAANKLQLFDYVYISSTFGKSKVIDQVLKEHKLAKEEVVYIGDETRDVSAALKSGIKTAGATWGLALRQALEALNPHYILETPDEILELVKE